MKNKSFPEPVEFYPTNLDRYVGKTPIIMRSSWEKFLAEKLDTHPNVLAWASESVIIPYYNPVKKKQMRYHTDFVVEFIDNNKNTVIHVIEVKPFEEAKRALLLLESQKQKKMLAGIASTSRNKKTRAYQDMTTAVNAAKWASAMEYCNARGWIFQVMTENQLFGKTKI